MTVLVLVASLAMGGLASPRMAPDDAKDVAALLLSCRPPLPRQSDGDPDESCLKPFARIDRYSTKSIRAGLSQFVKETHCDRDPFGPGQNDGREAWLRRFALIYCLNRYLFRLPIPTSEHVGHSIPAEGDDAWPIGRDAKGALRVKGAIDGWAISGLPYSWARDFDHCSTFGRRFHR